MKRVGLLVFSSFLGWSLPASADVIPLGHTMEVDMPTGSVIVTQNLTACGQKIHTGDQFTDYKVIQHLLQEVKPNRSIDLNVSMKDKHYTLRCTKKEIESIVQVSVDCVTATGTLSFTDEETGTYYALLDTFYKSPDLTEVWILWWRCWNKEGILKERIFDKRTVVCHFMSNKRKIILRKYGVFRCVKSLQ